MVKVSIIGTAGRGPTRKRLSKDVFDFMVNKSIEIITEKLKLELNNVEIVSGGAAWAGNLAFILKII